jgi:hypothetical protein
MAVVAPIVIGSFGVAYVVFKGKSRDEAGCMRHTARKAAWPRLK